MLLVTTPQAPYRNLHELIASARAKPGDLNYGSFGVASLPDDEASTAEDLFRSADEALYAAKRAGKNQVAAATGSPAKVL